MDASMMEAILADSPVEPYVRILRRLAEADPDFEALVCEDEVMTRGRLERQSNRLARAYAEKGVSYGDYVAIALPNGIGFYVSFLATLKLGAVPMPLSYRLPAAERRTIADLADVRLIVGGSRDDHPGRECVDADFTPGDDLSDEPLPEVVSPAWKAPTSGGSTGRPKIIVAGTGAEGSPATNALVFQYGPEDTQLVVGPLYHNSALASSFGGLLLGQRVVVMKRFEAEKLLDLVAKHKITWLMLVPTMMHRIQRLFDAGGEYDLSSIRILWHMASKCPEWLKRAWIDRLGAEKILELYGGTELQAVAIISGPEWLEHPGSIGRAVIGHMKVLDAAGDEVPPGTVGEIFMKRADNTPPTYRYIGAESKELNGWESLGDLGWQDEDGYLYISDRRVDMIVSGGANVYPAEVENALDAHPRVLSTVVVGIPDDDLGQRVHALVEAEPGTTGEELLEFLSDKLVRYKIPRTLEFIDRPLRDDAGKVRRSKMRDEAIERMKTSA
ncbi:AMP-binding protein [Streptomyces sp. NPDC056296]|uniref:AMP-binding protein n=1 Tax=Streptomyces sp. NPDC056296 TaxID=3345775 RepID=UPI0035DF0374